MHSAGFFSPASAVLQVRYRQVIHTEQARQEGARP